LPLSEEPEARKAKAVPGVTTTTPNSEEGKESELTTDNTFGGAFGAKYCPDAVIVARSTCNRSTTIFALCQTAHLRISAAALPMNVASWEDRIGCSHGRQLCVNSS